MYSLQVCWVGNHDATRDRRHFPPSTRRRDAYHGGTMNGSCQISLNGSEVWAYVVETGEGMRLRLDLTDWERTGLCVNRGVPVRLPEKPDEWLFVTHATELPPFVLVVMTKSVWAERSDRVSEN